MCCRATGMLMPPAVDLDAWFADRDVQAFVERIDRQSARQNESIDWDTSPAGLEFFPGLSIRTAPSQPLTDAANGASIAGARMVDRGHRRRSRRRCFDRLADQFAAWWPHGPWWVWWPQWRPEVTLRPRATAPDGGAVFAGELERGRIHPEGLKTVGSPQPNRRAATDNAPIRLPEISQRCSPGQPEPLQGHGPDDAQVADAVPWLDRKLWLFGDPPQCPIGATAPD